MRAATALSLAVSLSLACGDDDDPPPEVDAGVRVDAGTDAGPPPDDSPWKGPWVLRPATERASIVWESRLAPPTVAVEYQPEDGSGAPATAAGTSAETVVTAMYNPPIADQPDLPGTYYVNTVDVTGLSPATCYAYAIVDHPDASGRFCTMHASDDHTTPIQFYVLGDTSPGLGNTTEILAATDPADSEFVVHAGDIQYYSAIIETWQLWFGMMDPMLSAGAFMPCVGNHEDEIENELTDYYVRLFGDNGDDGTDFYYHYETGGVHFFSLSTEHDLDPGTDQHAWFTTRLAEVEADPDYRFSVVYFHRAYYTVGDHSIRQSQRDVLEPIIDAHRVPLVIAGHMHGYERFEVGDVTYITTGGGGSLLGDIEEMVAERPADAALRVAFGRFYHSVVINIEGSTIRGTITDETGMVHDSFEKTVTIPP